VRHFFSLLRHEIGVLIINPATYIATVVFLVLMGFFFQELLAEYSNRASDTSPAVGFFKLFWVPVFIIAPLLTMRSIAEERRMGTIETLLTTPVSAAEVVLAKYLAAYAFFVALWLSTLSFQWVLLQFADDPSVIDPGPLIGGYVFVALSGLLYVAIGIFASALTRKQLVAALIAFVLNGVFTLGFISLNDVAAMNAEPNGLLQAVAEHVNVFQHAEDFVTGVIDSRAFVLYLSLTGVFLFLGVLALDARSART